MGLSIVVPCLNEAQTIRQVVSQAHAALAELRLPGEVLVIDNGSSDQSRELATQAGARVLCCANRGYGSALRYGFNQAQYNVVAMLDADLSYPPSELPKMFATLSNGHDFVLGNRLHGSIADGAMPLLNRYLGTPILSALLRLGFGLRTFDCNSGMRLIRSDALRQMQLRSQGMELAAEMLIRAARLRLRYAEVAIVFQRDQRGRPSHLHRWRDGIRHLRLMWREWRGALGSE